MVDKSDLIIDKIETLSDSFKEHKTDSNKRFDEYNGQLKIHIKGTTDNTKLINANKIETDTKIIELQKPNEFLKNLKTVALYIAAFAGCYLTIMKIIKG